MGSMVIDKDEQMLKSILGLFDKETIAKAIKSMGEMELNPNAKGTKAIKRKLSEFSISKGEDLQSTTEMDRNVVSIDEIKSISRTERRIQTSNFLPAHFLEEGALVLKSVARVKLESGDYGSGFLVSPSLFMTNNHVLPAEVDAKRAKFEFNYQYDFHGNLQHVDTYTADPSKFFHTSISLDYTLVRLNPKIVPDVTSEKPGAQFHLYVPNSPPGGMAIPGPKSHLNAGDKWGYLRLRARRFAENQMCNIVQHPDGRYKEIAIHENKITKVFPNVIRYVTDTEPGSSGSPVFDNEWDLIAIHHAAGDEDPANKDVWLDNEGIRIDHIIEDIKQSLSNNPSKQEILSELGIDSV